MSGRYLSALGVAVGLALQGCHPVGSAETQVAARPILPAQLSESENAAIDQAAPRRGDDTTFFNLPDDTSADAGAGTTQDDPLAQEVAGERIQQADLPQAHDREWAVLRTTRIGIDGEGYYTATHSPQVRALGGSRLTISGFMVPLEATDTTRHFLISPYTPVCFFCPPGEPNEVIEVHTKRPIRSGYSLVRISGTFGLANNADKGLFFTLDDSDAQVLREVRVDQ